MPPQRRVPLVGNIGDDRFDGTPQRAFRFLRIRGARRPLQVRDHVSLYLTAMGLMGEPTAPVMGSGGAQKKNS